MPKTTKSTINRSFVTISIALLCLISIVGCEPTPKQINNQKGLETPEPVKIANWNLQIFGNTKASKPELLQTYANIINDYDIIFVQEIRNSNQTAFPKLCALLPEYEYLTSSRAGRSSSKEQYGVIYKKGIEIVALTDYNPDSQNRWERPPVKVTFDINGYQLTAYNIHTKPTDTPAEIDHLESIAQPNGNVIILGDLNADCSYYNHTTSDDFSDWHWVINDDEDTTVAATDCAYDRIIVNDNAFAEYLNSGVYSTSITSNESDHYLVWMEFSPQE